MTMFGVRTAEKNNSIYHDPTTFGAHCTVFDFWSDKKQIFPSRDIPLHLENYLYMDKNYEPVTEPFDQEKHQIELLTTSMLSSYDFLYSTESAHDQEALDWYKDKLIAFEQTADDKEKQLIALEIISMHPKCYDPQNKKITKLLLSQMKYFIDPRYAKVHTLVSTTPKEQSVFNRSDVYLDIPGNYLSNIMINYLCKTAELFQNNETHRALKKFSKLHLSIQEQIHEKLMQPSYISNPNISGQTKAEALYYWIMDKIYLAQISRHEKSARAIFQQLPKDIQLKTVELLDMPDLN